MRDRRLIGFSALLFSLVLAGISPLSVSASSPVRFGGAHLSHSTQPTPSEQCGTTVGKSNPRTCTWVAVEAFENGGHEQAPKDGTIGKVRIVSCVGGSFTVQVARARPGHHQAKIVRSGPTLTYVKDTQSGRLRRPQRRQLQHPDLHGEPPREQGRLHRRQGQECRVHPQLRAAATCWYSSHGFPRVARTRRATRRRAACSSSSSTSRSPSPRTRAVASVPRPFLIPARVPST